MCLLLYYYTIGCTIYIFHRHYFKLPYMEYQRGTDYNARNTSEARITVQGIPTWLGLQCKEYQRGPDYHARNTNEARITVHGISAWPGLPRMEASETRILEATYIKDLQLSATLVRTWLSRTGHVPTNW